MECSRKHCGLERFRKGSILPWLLLSGKNRNNWVLCSSGSFTHAASVQGLVLKSHWKRFSGWKCRCRSPTMQPRSCLVLVLDWNLEVSTSGSLFSRKLREVAGASDGGRMVRTPQALSNQGSLLFLGDSFCSTFSGLWFCLAGGFSRGTRWLPQRPGFQLLCSNPEGEK